MSAYGDGRWLPLGLSTAALSKAFTAAHLATIEAAGVSYVAETGGTRWLPKLVPLNEGTARWAQAFRLLRQTGWDLDGQVVVSLHSENQGDSSWRDRSSPWRS